MIDYLIVGSGIAGISFAEIALQNNNLQLEKAAGSIGELQSRLENSLLERDVLLGKISTLEAQKFIKEI